MSYGPLTHPAPAYADCEWPGTESNRRHRGFQPRALPTELPGQAASSTITTNQTPPTAAFEQSSGGRIRTCDLRVMSPTSYLAAPPRNRKEKLPSAFGRVNPLLGHFRPLGKQKTGSVRICFLLHPAPRSPPPATDHVQPLPGIPSSIMARINCLRSSASWRRRAPFAAPSPP